MNRDRTPGSASASTAAAFSLRIMSVGVPLGAKSPNQPEKESDGHPTSRIVGISGACDIRVPLSTAYALMVPERTSVRSLGAGALIKRSIWPAIKSCIAGAPPRYGTRANCVPVSFRKKANKSLLLLVKVAAAALLGLVFSQVINSFRSLIDYRSQ